MRSHGTAVPGKGFYSLQAEGWAMGRRYLGLAALTFLMVAAGCSWLGMGQSGNCYNTRLAPARLFAIEAPATASANATLSLTPWVSLMAPVTKLDQLATQSFQAEVDAASRTITVTGQVFRTEAVAGAGCTYPMLNVPDEAASLSLAISAPPGTYTLQIPASHFTTDRPGAPAGLPEAAATRSLVLELP